MRAHTLMIQLMATGALALPDDLAHAGTALCRILRPRDGFLPQPVALSRPAGCWLSAGHAAALLDPSLPPETLALAMETRRAAVWSGRVLYRSGAKSCQKPSYL